MNNNTNQLPENFNSLLKLLAYFKDEQTCIDYFAQKRWNGEVICPFCGHNKAYKFTDNKRYKCASCRLQFTVKIGTIFEDSKIPLRKWFVAIYLITSHKKGISSHQLAKDIKVTQKTAWFILHRIRFALNQGGFEMPLGSDDDGGIVEIDESFVGGKNKNRHKNKKVERSQGRSYKDKTPVLGLLQREVSEIVEREHKVIPGKTVEEKVIKSESKLVCKVIPDTKSETIQPIVLKEVKAGVRVVTDEWWGYRQLNAAFEHFFVNHAEKEFVRGDIHINTLEGFWGLFKRSIIGIYHFVSKKHIQKYLDESAFRYNTRRINEGQRVSLMLTQTGGRLDYKTLIRK